MNREGKSKFIDIFSDCFKASESTFIVKVDGLTVKQFQNLRSKLRENEAKVQVGKVRLMKRAIEASDGDASFIDSLGGQIAAVFSQKESQQVAKDLVGFGKENEAMSLVSGVFQNKFMSEADVKSLASIPPHSVLVSRLAGALNGPISGLARSLNEVSTKLARALKAVADKG